MKLWIDDVRAAPPGWTRAKNAHEALRYLSVNWYDITDISFDHDLGDDSKSGYEILNWIERRVADGHSLVARLQVHSANPVGRKNMLAAINSIARFAQLS